ncbi:hypothetical protein ABPG74_001653 [Tetrahymena malaccensis]
MRFMDEIRDEYFRNVLPIITNLVSKELSIAINQKILKVKDAQWRSALMVCHRYLYVNALVVSPLINTDSKGIPEKNSLMQQFYEQQFKAIQQRTTLLKIFGILFYFLIIAARLFLQTYYYCGYLDLCMSSNFRYFIAASFIWGLYAQVLIYPQIIYFMGSIVNRRLFSLSRLSELINIQNQKPLLFTPKELPSLNIFCFVSVESWNNIRKFIISDCQSARNNADIAILVMGSQTCIQGLLLTLDYFYVLDSKYEQQYIWSDTVFVTIMVFESLFYVIMVFFCLKKKADFNLYFQEFKTRIQTVISVLKKFEFQCTIYFQKDENNEYQRLSKTSENSSKKYSYDEDQFLNKLLEDQVFENSKDIDFEEPSLLHSQDQQNFNINSFKLLVKEAKNYELIKLKSNGNNIEKSEHDIVFDYIRQLSKQFKEIQSELQLDQELRSEMFLNVGDSFNY